MKITIKKAKQSKVQELACKYRDLADKKLKFMQKYDKIFTNLEKITSEMEALHVELQVEARKKAKEGQTVNVVDMEGIRVTTNVPRQPVRYSYEEAKRRWPKSVLQSVLTIDAKAVHKAISEGDLDEEDAKEAEESIAYQGPRVTIKVT